MSASTQNIDLDEIAKKLLILLSFRKSNTCGDKINNDGSKNLFENIYPYFQYPDTYVFYLPQPRPKLIDHSFPWKTAYNAAILNQYIEKDVNGNAKTITVNVDAIIGEAIQNRIRKYSRVNDPKPYEFQMKALATALAALDPVRKYLRDGDVAGVKKYFANNGSLTPKVIAALASTGGGKTEIFETLALQLTLDSFTGASKKNDKSIADFTKAILVYPMKAFMIDHFRRFVEDVTYINNTFLNGKEFKINVGILHGDTPSELTNKDQILSLVEYLLYDKNCPMCGGELEVKTNYNGYPYYSIKCKNNHRINIIISKDKLFSQPPDILLTTIDAFNYILLEPNRHKLMGKGTTLPPLLLAVDEPHIYTGVFGSNVSLIFRAFDYAVQQYTGSQTYKPLKIATSATMPHAQEFLAKLFVESINDIKIIESSPSGQEPKNKTKGILALLPDSGYGFQNATVEIIPLIAGLLPKELRKVLVFVDSREYAETLKRQIEDFIMRGLPDFGECLHLLKKDVYDSVTKKVNYDAIRVAVHTSDISENQRKEIEIGLRNSPPKYNIVIATPTLEVGIDIGDITVVVIAGLPPTPEKFAQRAGRAGRREKGLVTIIGNNSSGVDRYYLADNDKLKDYLQMSLGFAKKLDYMLPLNPLNLESTRRFLGNFMAIYANVYYANDNYSNVRLYQLNKLNNKILKDYMNLGINRIHKKLSSSQSSVVNNVATFAKSIENEIKTELMNRFQTIIRVAGNASIKRFIAPTTASKIFALGKIDFIPVLDNIRSTKRFVSIVYYDSVNTKKSKITETKEDIERALASYAITEIEPTTTSTTYEYILPITRYHSKNMTIYPLRGTLRYYSSKGESELFEVSGLFYNIYNKKYYNIIVNLINKYVDNLNLLNQTSAQIDNEIKRNSEIFGKYFRWINITTIRVYNLINSLRRFLEVTSEYDTHIVEPRAFYLTKSGILGRDKNNNNLLIRLWPYTKKGKKTEQIITSLEHFEAFETTSKGRSYWKFSKIVSVKCPKCKSEDTIEYREYDQQHHILSLYCRKCNIPFTFPDPKNNKVNIEIHMLKTKPVFFNLVINRSIKDRQLTDKIINVSSPLRKINVFMGNVGFRVSSTSNRRVGGFISTKLKGNYEQSIVGTDYETQGIEIEIDWIKQVNILQKLLLEINGEFKKLIKLEDMPPNLNILNDFKIRVTHTLSHMIINFAPIYTGGNRWDINEYLDFEKDSNGDIIGSRIIIFDTDEGGNGVSELIKYFFKDILTTGLNEAAKYYVKARDPTIRFMGEPGITFFGVWPICPYSNLGVSRSLTLLYFKHLLNKQSIDDLQNVKPDELSGIIGLEEEK